MVYEVDQSLWFKDVNRWHLGSNNRTRSAGKPLGPWREVAVVSAADVTSLACSE